MAKNHAEPVKLADQDLGPVQGFCAVLSLMCAARETVLKVFQPQHYVGTESADQRARKAVQTAMNDWDKNNQLLATSNPAAYKIMRAENLRESFLINNVPPPEGGASGEATPPPGFKRTGG